MVIGSGRFTGPDLLAAVQRAPVSRWAGILAALPMRGDCARRKVSSGNCGRHAGGPDDHRVELAFYLGLEVGVDLVDLG